MRLTAICDIWEERLETVGRAHGVATFTDYDAFLDSGLDAVILANYFHEHAPLAVKALEAGKHVLSETAANGTLADGVALCRAVERSGCVYMLAENYCYTLFSQEMRRLYQHRGDRPGDLRRGRVQPPHGARRRACAWRPARTTGATGSPRPTTAPTPWRPWYTSPAPCPGW